MLDRRRTAAADAWNLESGVVLVEAGHPVPIPGRGDPTYPFRAHSEYFWLTDRERPGGVIAYDPAQGWTEFVDPVTTEELVWTGLEGDREGVPEGTRPLDELAAFVGGRSPRTLGATTSPDIELRDALIRARRPKDDDELARMRTAVAATSAGFAELRSLIAAGQTERELQIALEAEFMRNGGDFLSFETIVAAGNHAAVLHFTPTLRELADGQVLLVDAGAEHRGYAADVTRTYPVSDRFGAEQQIAFDAVHRALDDAIAMCRPGVQWRDVHRAASLAIADGLVELGVLRGNRESLVDTGAVRLFFPHGVGHMVGLGVRDAGAASDEPSSPGLRLDIPLELCHAWTVEPGLYFVAPLLARERGHEGVNWERVDELLDFGGVRLEHDVVITDDGCDVLTAAIPL
jgi:Xaa-Pro aminopeptidase